jgi:hypothetical protein
MLHQGALAGPVLTDQRQPFAGCDPEVNLLKRNHAAG